MADIYGLDQTYYFKDPDTYPFMDLIKTNNNTVNAIRIWFMELYINNSEVEHHECSDDELENVNNCITLMIGNRLYKFLKLINSTSINELKPEPPFIENMIYGVLATISMIFDPNGSYETTINVRDILSNLFGNLIFNYSSTTYRMMVSICRDEIFISQRANVNVWIDLPPKQLIDVSGGETDQIIERIGTAMIEDGLICGLDVGLSFVKSATKL